MPSRFEKFSERARRVLSLAQEEAQRFNHNYIGTEHILLGLVRETEGVAARVLLNLNVELVKVRSAVEFIIGRGERPTPGEIGLTPRAKKVIELTQSTSQLIYNPLPENDPVRRQPDITLAGKMLGWKPTVELEEGLGNTINYFSNLSLSTDLDTKPERIQKYFKKAVSGSDSLM